MNGKVSVSVDGVTIEDEVVIRHSTYTSYSGFYHKDSGEDYEPIGHTVEVVLPLEFLLETNPTLTQVELRKHGYLVTEGSDPEICVAEIFVREFPSRWREEMGVSWADWLDAYDGDAYQAGIRADEVDDSMLYDLALLDGSLFLFDRLHVHPLFRKQGIGARLTKHLSFVLAKSTGDFAIILASPTDSIYENGDESRIPDGYSLAKYYERAGFTRVEERDGVILLEAHIGE